MNNFQSFTVIGESMFPFLKDGDKVVADTNVKPLSFSKRDIVIYKVKDRYVCHRIINVRIISGKKYYYVKGDYSRGVDLISADDVLGKVKAALRKGKIYDVSSFTARRYFFLVRCLFFLKMLAIRMLNFLYSFRALRFIVRVLFKTTPSIIYIGDIKKDKRVSSFANFCEDIYYQKRLKSYLAVYNKKVIGKVLWYAEESSIFIIGPYVRVLYRARGVGSALVRELLRKYDTDSFTFFYSLPSDRNQIKAFKSFYSSFARVKYRRF